MSCAAVRQAVPASGCLGRSGAAWLERAKGIEPSYAAWEAAVLPLNYARKTNDLPSLRDPRGWRLCIIDGGATIDKAGAVGNFRMATCGINGWTPPSCRTILLKHLPDVVVGGKAAGAGVS